MYLYIYILCIYIYITYSVWLSNLYLYSRCTRKIQKSIRVFFRHGSWIDGFDMIWWARWTFTDIEKAVHSNQKHQRDVRIFISPTSGISYTEFLAACLEDTHSSWSRAFLFLFFLLGQLLKTITRYSFTRLFMLKARGVRIQISMQLRATGETLHPGSSVLACLQAP